MTDACNLNGVVDCNQLKKRWDGVSSVAGSTDACNA